MDLNKAMSDLYKQRRESNQKKNPNKAAGKRNSVSHNESATMEDDPTSKKRSKVDELLSQLVCNPKVSFDKLFGCDDAIQQIIKILARFNRHLAGKSTKSQWPVLLCGSRGLGKTSLVEAAAHHSLLKLFKVSFKSLIEQSRTELKVTLTFITRHCQANQPAIVLLDDIDRVNDKEELRLVVDAMISRLMEAESKLLIFCTANSSLDVSPNLDFLYTIQLKRPDPESRFSILRLHRDQNDNLSDLNDDILRSLALSTPSFSALDLQKMLDMAETESPSGKPNQLNCDKAIVAIKQSFRKGTHLIGERPSVTWKDVGGLSEVRHAFIDIMRKIRTGNMNCKFAGICLYGPPGCGKTMVAQAMANDAGLNFISVKPAELVDKYLGETEKNIRRVFSEAQEFEPCMIYFDEFDGLCGTRGNNRDSVTSAIQTLLSEMDGFVHRGKSIILASTNQLEDIDPAMKRPGRLSRHIYIGPPNLAARGEILRVIFENYELSNDIDVNQWADLTDGFTGADLAYLVAEAELKATSKNLSYSMDIADVDETKVLLTHSDLDQAMQVILKSNVILAKRKKTK